MLAPASPPTHHHLPSSASRRVLSRYPIEPIGSSLSSATTRSSQCYQTSPLLTSKPSTPSACCHRSPKINHTRVLYKPRTSYTSSDLLPHVPPRTSHDAAVPTSYACLCWTPRAVSAHSHVAHKPRRPPYRRTRQRRPAGELCSSFSVNRRKHQLSRTTRLPDAISVYSCVNYMETQ
jgi:hypothetical protein